MSRQDFLILPVFGLLVSACYGAAPPKPTPVAMPEVATGSHLAVDSQSTTAFENVSKQSETCPRGHASGSEACVVTTYTVKEPVTRTKTTATYGDTQLSYGQFQVLVDSEYDQKLTEISDHSDACQGANTPRYIGMGLLIGGAVAYAFSGTSKAVQVGATLGLLGGAGSYTAGYFAFGGNRCVEAGRLYRQINYARDSGVMTVHGGSRAQEMRAVADEFNRRAGRAAAAAE